MLTACTVGGSSISRHVDVVNVRIGPVVWAPPIRSSIDALGHSMSSLAVTSSTATTGGGGHTPPATWSLAQANSTGVWGTPPSATLVATNSSTSTIIAPLYDDIISSIICYTSFRTRVPLSALFDKLGHAFTAIGARYTSYPDTASVIHLYCQRPLDHTHK
jgi:hypothetical protein